VAALLGLGFGVLVGSIVALMPVPWAPEASQISLWAGLTIAVLYAFATHRPAGLLGIRGVDFLWGIALGVGLRFAQGILSQADIRTFPSLSDIAGGASHDFSFLIVPSAAIVGPLVEEFFFRGVLVVAIYQVLRRQVDHLVAAFASLLASAGGFVLLHVAFSPLQLSDAVQLSLIGGTCALLVLLTGRIWGAVLAHVTYNILYLALALAGSLLA
jgi:membrane protease YdiL (CAAX protease family)